MRAISVTKAASVAAFCLALAACSDGSSFPTGTQPKQELPKETVIEGDEADEPKGGDETST